MHHTLSYASIHLSQIWKESIQSFMCCRAHTTRCAIYVGSFIAKSWLNDLEDIGQGQGSLCATHPLCLTWKESIQICSCYRADTDGRTDERAAGAKPIHTYKQNNNNNNNSNNDDPVHWSHMASPRGVNGLTIFLFTDSQTLYHPEKNSLEMYDFVAWLG